VQRGSGHRQNAQRLQAAAQDFDRVEGQWSVASDQWLGILLRQRLTTSH